MRLTAVLLCALALCLVGFVFAVYDYARHGTVLSSSRVVPAVQTSAAPSAFEPTIGASPLPSAQADQPSSAPVDGTGPVALAPAEVPAVQPQPDTAPPPEGRKHSHDGQGHDKHDGGGGGGD
jgi:hypothetical protein